MTENNLKPWELSQEKIAQLLDDLDKDNDMKCGECRQALIKIGQKILFEYLNSTKILESKVFKNGNLEITKPNFVLFTPNRWQELEKYFGVE
jgi:hypothetical protein